MVTFQYTQFLFQTTSNILNAPNQSCSDCLGKVGAVAHLVLGMIPLFIADLVSLAARKLHQICYPPTIQSGGKKRIGDADIDRIIQAPRIQSATPQQILEISLRHAFSHLDPSVKALYRDLIAGDGESDLPHSEATTPNIFQWCAAVYLAYLLRMTFIYNYYLPEGIPLLTIRDLQGDYRKLSRSEKAATLMTIYRQPASEWQLSEKAHKMVQEIQTAAHMLNQNQQYLRLYGPVSKRINEIFT